MPETKAAVTTCINDDRLQFQRRELMEMPSGQWVGGVGGNLAPGSWGAILDNTLPSSFISKQHVSKGSSDVR